MCVGLSARVVSVKGGSAVIDASGARRTVSAELLDELEPGDYVMVHAGIAIAKITNSSEEESTQIMEQLDENAPGNN
ncbi:MAG: HypC/HybG/HupF family hydrogenase formation chaperone [Lentisphaeria bacterium]|nr:HypC/HybG/HupF family hydrogenase formation chaperone [Lentisphaeria bacterium]